jgi:hypothetical protein
MTVVRKDGPITIFHDPIRNRWILRCWFCQTHSFHERHSDALDAFHNHNHEGS